MVSGDGRMDSPGYCAQYCTYILMDNQSKQILTCQTIDKREVDLKSTNMEAKGFVNGLEELKKKKIQVVEVVTYAHLTISSTMSMSLIHAFTFLAHMSEAQVSFTNPTSSVVAVRRLLFVRSSASLTFLGQCASELCSDKKFDPREGHLRGVN